jgi:hypothetical protein
MECGDQGQILLSWACAEIVNQFQGWSEQITDLGECEVKHGIKLHIANLAGSGYGREVRPSRAGRLGAPSSDNPPPPAPESKKIVLLYRRKSVPDNYVLELLESRLKLRGHAVFVDRHLSIGMKWAEEIERRIRGADVVIPLISDLALGSEMLEYEIQVAYDAAQGPKGGPKLLPVCIRLTAPLTHPLSGILKTLQHATWDSAADDEHLIHALIAAVERGPEPDSTPTICIEQAGGAVPLDSAFYVVRRIDELFLQAVQRNDSIVLVKGARQMGKTSLLARGLAAARASGALVVTTDFQTLNESHLSTLDRLYLAIASSISDQLDLDEDPEEHWSPSRGANINFERFLRRQVLDKGPQRIVWGLDEVDRLFTFPNGSEVFGMFRSWHNRRALEPSGPWSKLTLAIAYATEAHLFISDLNQSPFNVGTRLTADDFDRGQMAELNRRYGSPLTSSDLEDLYQLVNGHPYLVRRVLQEMITHHVGYQEISREAALDEGLFGDHLRRILVSLARDPQLASALIGVIVEGTAIDEGNFYRLRASGIMKGNGPAEAQIRCDLYRRYLSRHFDRLGAH